MEKGRDVITLSEDGSDVVIWDWTIGGVAVNLATAYASGRMQIRRSGTQTSALLGTLTTEDGGLVLGTDGTLTANLPYAFTSTLPVGTHSFDVRLIDNLGQPHYCYGGPFIVPPTVTAPEEA